MYVAACGVVTLTVGPFLSTLLPPIGSIVAQFVATSHTVWLTVEAFAVSDPAGTAVATESVASVGSARPEVASVAVQPMVASAACQLPSGLPQVTTGVVWSISIVVVAAGLVRPPTSIDRETRVWVPSPLTTT